MIFNIFFPIGYNFFNNKTQDIISKHFSNDQDFVFHRNTNHTKTINFMKENIDDKNQAVLFYYHPSPAPYLLNILQYIHSLEEKPQLKIVFFTFDFWLRGDVHFNKFLKYVFKAKFHYVFTFADSLETINELHNFDYQEYKRNIVFFNVWSCYNLSFCDFNENPIRKVGVTGKISCYYPDRVKLSKLKKYVDIIRFLPKETRAKDNPFSKRLNKYLCCLSSPAYFNAPNQKTFINTHLIPLKTFEILASGSLLLCPKTEEEPLKKIGLIHKKNCYLIDINDSAKDLQFITDPNNFEQINKMRMEGHKLAKDELNSCKIYLEIKKLIENL